MSEGNEPKKRRGLSAVILILALIVLWAAYQVTQDYVRYKASNRRYEELEKSVVSKRNVQTDITPKLSHEEQKYEAPIQVDFGKLQDQEHHIKGWLYVEALEISYPVLQADDNDYYLHRTLEGQYEYAGSIFMDSQNSPDFTDPNTMIFGHNMADGSMFGKLKQFSLNNATAASPYVWVLTEEEDYCYQVMSIQVVSTSSECYTLFSDTTRYVEFLERMRLNSSIETGDWNFSESDRLLTLSTCNGDGNQDSRYVVQAIKIK